MINTIISFLSIISILPNKNIVINTFTLCTQFNYFSIVPLERYFKNILQSKYYFKYTFMNMH